VYLKPKGLLGFSSKNPKPNQQNLRMWVFPIPVARYSSTREYTTIAAVTELLPIINVARV
jgi:hypothetical protein